MRELKIKKCLNCGAVVKVINDCNCEDCGITCCGEPMTLVKANSVDAAFEKHVPTYEIVDDEIVVKVNHVMDDEHYIMWIALIGNEAEEYVYLNPGDEAVARFKKHDKGKLYSYCNLHSLWETEII